MTDDIRAHFLTSNGLTPSERPIGAIVRTYIWGLDIARSLTDAGGVGALLQIADHASGQTYFPAYDGNGNVTVLVNSTTTERTVADVKTTYLAGVVSAAFEYSPFGELLRTYTPDPTAGDQPFRFSTKYSDSETGLVYYGHRYYKTSEGRWTNRDRVSEKGGLNLYNFILNNPQNAYDSHGDLPILLVVAGASAVGGAAGQFFSDLLSGNELDWRNYAVAATTGAAAGAAIIFTGPTGQLLITATNNLATSLLQQGWTSGEISTTKAVASVATGTIVARIPLPGLNKGRNSYEAISQSTTTKATNGTIKNATIQTAGIMAASAVDGNLIPGAADGLLGMGADWLTSTAKPTSNDNYGRAVMMGAVKVSPAISGQIFTSNGKRINDGSSGKQNDDDDDDDDDDDEANAQNGNRPR